MEYLVIMPDSALGIGMYGEMVTTRFTFFDVRITNTNSAPQHNVKTKKVLL